MKNIARRLVPGPHRYLFRLALASVLGIVASQANAQTQPKCDTSVTLTNMLPCACDVRARYQHRENESNDPSAEYEADQVQLSFIARL